ncbi:uncharacterized protein LOC142233895 [Haematobia irritans]|uniref:uncharacterized protein LOC142233895 n=1 Tax=Haematobia irritans TaxID=7368 RepID=UPI003F4F6F9B
MNSYTSEKNNFTNERNNCRRKLILMVKQHPILWNKTQENYNRNRPLKSHTWEEIAEQLGMSVDKIRRTWENLRDQYRRDLKREMKYGFKSKWRFFRDMDFIREMVTCKGQVNELSDSDSDTEVQEGQQFIDHNIESNVNFREPQHVSMPTTNPNNFQPIVLSKQWQNLDYRDDLHGVQEFVSLPPSQNSFPAMSSHIAAGKCDSSKDSGKDGMNPIDIMDMLAKKETDSDVEIECEYIAESRPEMQGHKSEDIGQPQSNPYGPLPRVYQTDSLVTTTIPQREYPPSEASTCHREPVNIPRNPHSDLPNPMDLMAMLAKREPQTDSDVEVDNEPPTSSQPRSSIASNQSQQESHITTSGLKRSIDERPLEMPALNSATNRRKKSNETADVETKDEDYYFVMSLLPSIRQIPRNRKFALRIGIMNLIAKDLEELCK